MSTDWLGERGKDNGFVENEVERGLDREFCFVCRDDDGVSSIVWAQGVASVSGRAADTSGAIIPDARVTMRNVETGETRTTTSDAGGFYRMLSLPVGKYEVKV